MTQITAVAVFLKEKPKLLDSLVCFEKRSPDEDNYAGFWALPGGHKKSSETIKKTLIREMHEELNVEITNSKYIGKFRDIDPTSRQTYFHNVFICLDWKGKIKKTAEEEKLAWISIKEFFEKYKQSRHGKIRGIDRKILSKVISEINRLRKKPKEKGLKTKKPR